MLVAREPLIGINIILLKATSDKHLVQAEFFTFYYCLARSEGNFHFLNCLRFIAVLIDSKQYVRIGF